MNIDKANKQLKSEKLTYQNNTKMLAAFHTLAEHFDCDGDVILDGAYTLKDLKKIVEIMERNKD